jgi:hypothetical protein
MKSLRLFLALALASVVSAHAADLAPGLAYVRTTDTQVLAKALEAGSVVLDLRTVTDPVKPLRVPRTRVLLVLLSPETPAISIPGAITFGRAAPDFKTDIVVSTTAESDAKAVAALAADATPEKLIVENADKPRFDESILVREHESGAEPSAPADPAAKPADAPAPTVVVDAVLQRAVQVYRGLVALKKIPSP